MSASSRSSDTTRSADLGRVRCSLKGRIPAGSWQTCQLTYTAGFAGIDDTGSLKVVMRYATDAGRPQFDDPAAPHYTTALASNGVRLQLRYDLKDNIRPWGKTIHIKVLQGYLRKGDRITLTLGDRSGGSPGWRMQTFCEETFELRTLVDRYATYVYEQVPGAVTFRIVPGEPVRLVAIAPTQWQAGKPFFVRWRLEDAWGNPVGRPRRQKQAGFAHPGCYTVTIHDEATGLSAETNPVVVRAAGTGDSFGRFWADLHGQSEETIGTNSIEDYFRFARDKAFLDICSHQGNDFQITDAFWEKIQQTTKAFDQPGRFVTFPGWEWSGNTGLGGDRNVFYKDEGGLISRSSRALVSPEEAQDPCSEDVEELFDRLQRQPHDVMLVAHVGGRYADLNRHREELEKAVEVHSAWGTFEWMLDDAFRNGYCVAVVANSDGHKGRPGASHPGASTFGSYGGLTCVLAEELTREAVWEAYQSRRVYATTGARMALDFFGTISAGIPDKDRTNRSPRSRKKSGPNDQRNIKLLMGSLHTVEPASVPRLHVEVHGTAPLERVEVRNGMKVLKTMRPYTAEDLSDRIKILWEGAAVRGRGRQVKWDGGLQVLGNRIAGFRPINFWNRDKRCVQKGPRQLQWESLTTGGTAGVIVQLAKGLRGKLHIRTAQKNLTVSVARLGVKGTVRNLGGVGKRLSVYRLPAEGGSRSLSFTFQPRWQQLAQRRNPLYVHVVQEDGQMAWSSPIYLDRPL